MKNQKTLALSVLSAFLISLPNIALSQTNSLESTNGPFGGRIVHAITINSSDHIFAGTDDTIFRSTDGGETWRPVITPFTVRFVEALAINDSGHIFAGSPLFDSSIFRSTDNGESWEEFAFVRVSAINDFAIDSNGDIFTGTFGVNGGVYRSVDNGETWTDVNNGLTSDHVKALAINSNDDIFAGTDQDGIFRSTDNGETWTAVNNGLTDLGVWSLAINSNGDIFAGTFNGLFVRQTTARIGLSCQVWEILGFSLCLSLLMDISTQA